MKRSRLASIALAGAIFWAVAIYCAGIMGAALAVLALVSLGALAGLAIYAWTDRAWLAANRAPRRR